MLSLGYRGEIDGHKVIYHSILDKSIQSNKLKCNEYNNNTITTFIYNILIYPNITSTIAPSSTVIYKGKHDML